MGRAKVLIEKLRLYEKSLNDEITLTESLARYAEDAAQRTAEEIKASTLREFRRKLYDSFPMLRPSCEAPSPRESFSLAEKYPNLTRIWREIAGLYKGRSAHSS